jgi:hypothetical protein
LGRRSVPIELTLPLLLLFVLSVQFFLTLFISVVALRHEYTPEVDAIPLGTEKDIPASAAA